MGNFNELEIEIADGGNDEYRIELHLDFASSAARGERKSTRLSKMAFHELDQHDVKVNFEEYGKALTQIVWIDTGFVELVEHVRAASRRQRRQLRIRLFIDDDAKELHRLHWETLHDVDLQSETWLLANESILFSRDLGSSQLDEELPLRTREQLRALIVVSNPDDIGNGKKYSDLTLVDVEGESGRTRQAMRELRPPEVFVSPPEGSSGPFVTLAGLIDRLSTSADAGYDILYLVCHGKIVKDEPHIWLQTDNGQSAVIGATGNDGLVTRIKNLPPDKKPRLIVLASCDSGGGLLTTDGALAALGPRLVREADIPAVVAMGASVTMNTIEKFMPRFFEQLARHGQIDQALAAARGEIADEHDAWMPILYMRLKNGSIWSPGWADPYASKTFGGFKALSDNIQAGTCVPILGPGVLDFFTGPRGSFSARWAEDQGVPRAITPTSLPQVAQYISTMVGDPRTVSRRFMQFVQEVICVEYETVLLADCQAADINQLIKEVATLRRQHDEYQDAIYQLAKLPLPIYITTNPDRLLASSLMDLGKPPREAAFSWDPVLASQSRDDPALYELLVLDPDYQPTPENPLVYYLFGRIDHPETLALTEDDFFDYLLRIRSANGDEYELPPLIRKMIYWNPVLFLGFSHDDWAFRVMLRSLLGPSDTRPPGKRLLAAALVGADTNYEDYDRMQQYLEQYFEANRIRIYWGNTIDFVCELVKSVDMAVT